MKKPNADSRTVPAATIKQAYKPCPKHQSDSERRAELARLLPLWPAEIADLTMQGRRRIIATLSKALRVERVRGKAGHWAYDLARHVALSQNWKNECAALRSIEMRKSAADHISPQQTAATARTPARDHTVFMMPELVIPEPDLKPDRQSQSDL